MRALTERAVKVLYVTHMFDLAEGFYRLKIVAALFLRAERLSNGQRTFRLIAAEPLPTGYGEDLYQLIFGPAPMCPLPAVTRDVTCKTMPIPG